MKLTEKAKDVLINRKAAFIVLMYLALTVGAGFYWASGPHEREAPGITEKPRIVHLETATNSQDGDTERAVRECTADDGDPALETVKENRVSTEEGMTDVDKTDQGLDVSGVLPGNET